MLQRIQSVYLFLSAMSMGAFLYFPLIAHTNGTIYDPLPGWDVRHFMVGYVVYLNLIFSATVIGLSLVNIFLFKWRGLQQLFSAFAIVFIASAFVFVFYKYQTKIYYGEVVLTWWNIFAAVAALFQLLAIFAIRKDEELLKSVDRLR